MKYAIENENEIFVYGIPIKKKESFFDFPVSSHFLHIFKSDGETCPIKPFNVQIIKAKLICLPDDLGFVFMPLLHTLKQN